VPPTATCMNCHKLIWNDSPMLEPVRESFRSGEPIRWARVNDLPDFVYFNHSIHVAKGMGCVTCHGRVDKMPLLRQAVSLQMEWCLECHRAPQNFVRPRSEILNMEWAAEDQSILGAQLVEEYNIQSLLSCSVCHR
ncbi:MAG: cytochrome c3 family protein, partial [Thermoanaerobaculia bacterium]